MHDFGVKTIDEFGKMVLHLELRTKLRLSAGTEVTLFPVRNIVVLQKANEQAKFTTMVDELGRVTMPKELMEQMGWKQKNKISIYYVDEHMLILHKS